MKIAIASCFNAHEFPDQPAWRNVSAMNPDALVLLGDSVYMDIPWVQTFDVLVHPKDADTIDFVKHGLKLYARQLGQPDFKQLIARVKRTYAIWDDHDFLWNDAAGDSLPQVIHGDQIRASRAMFKAFREALAAGDPKDFPTEETDTRLNNPYEPPPSYQAIDIDTKVCLHLTDGRSFRNKHHLLGSAQRAQMTAELQARPQHVHLIASGIVFSGSRECWGAFPEDFEWMRKMALNYRILIMSGDVHQNRIRPSYAVPGGRPIFEITSSGMAIREYVVTGERLHNFGMIEITGSKINLSTFHGATSVLQHAATIDIARWN